MKKLVLATNNQGKVRELKAMLAGIYDEVTSLRDEGIQIEVVEDGTTFYENARKKALEISLLTDADVLADDSGLCVDALNDEPGVYSARYSGPHATDESNNEFLIQNVSKLPENQRDARYVCVLVLANQGKEKLSCEGECRGKILLEYRGTNGFGYDPLFYLPQYDQTFGELDSDLKNQMSHRAVALRKLKEALDEKTNPAAL